MKLTTTLSTANKLKNDPFGFIIDSLIMVIVNMLIPVPLAGTIINEFKVPILGMLASFIALALLLIITIGAVIFLPITATSGFFQTITSAIAPSSASNPLNIPIDTSFIPTDVPKQNPLGGAAMSFTIVTAYFMDPDYYLQFGENHTGIDLVPSDEYYKNSKTYQETKKVVVFATMNGMARHYVDEYGGETVEVVNADQSIKTIFIHFSQVFVESGNVVAGTPLGIMGKTGKATGEHVHYEIQVKDGNNWILANPLDYIH